ncbi:MAG TPA: hypothetical protein VF510_16135, partial [Ktedonobacterales bacterium]
MPMLHPPHHTRQLRPRSDYLPEPLPTSPATALTTSRATTTPAIKIKIAAKTATRPAHHPAYPIIPTGNNPSGNKIGN